MLDSLLDGMKGQVASALAEKAGLDMGQAEQAVPAAGESIKEGIMGAVSDGDVSGVMSMFSGGDMQSSSIFQKIAGIFTGKLGALGIGGGSAVSALALPMILNKIKGAASGESGEMDASGLMSVLGGGAGAGGIMGAVTGALGGGGDMLGGLKDKVADVAGDGGGLLGGLKDKVADVAGDGGGILGNVVDAVTGGADEAADGAGDLKDQAIDAVKDKLGGLFGK